MAEEPNKAGEKAGDKGGEVKVAPGDAKAGAEGKGADTATGAATTAGTGGDTLKGADGKDGTLLSGADTASGGEGDGKPGTWPEDWRQRYAKDDAKKLSKLERYGSPEAALDALFAAQAKIGSGELKTALAENATPEEVAEYRKANGIPEKAADYKLSLKDGLVIGDNYKPLVNTFLEQMHGKHASPEIVSAAVNAYFEIEDQANAQLQEADKLAREDGQDTLRAEWGSDFKGNLSGIKNLLASAPDGLDKRLLGARLSDGRLLGDDPAALRWLDGLRREVNPSGTVVPGVGATAAASLAEELAKLDEMMRLPRKDSPYWTGPNADKHQARYRQLIDMQNKVKPKAA